MAIRNIAVLALYNDKKEILLQHRAKDAKRLPDYWGLFGGGIDEGETPEQAVVRELMEELEYKVIAPTFLFAQKFEYKGDVNTKYIFIEKYTDIQNSFKQHEGQGMGWYNITDTVNLLMVDHDREVLSRIGEFLQSNK